nr:MAG TPA: hypothetical protein [Caudoviricetes sp.]DAZ07902.1 MAG TPA: hypothetical protein [Caudoviricetes sp.]
MCPNLPPGNSYEGRTPEKSGAFSCPKMDGGWIGRRGKWIL